MSFEQFEKWPEKKGTKLSYNNKWVRFSEKHKQNAFGVGYAFCETFKSKNMTKLFEEITPKIQGSTSSKVIKDRIIEDIGNIVKWLQVSSDMTSLIRKYFLKQQQLEFVFSFILVYLTLVKQICSIQNGVFKTYMIWHTSRWVFLRKLRFVWLTRVLMVEQIGQQSSESIAFVL